MHSWLGTTVPSTTTPSTPVTSTTEDDELVRSALAARDLIAEAKAEVMEQHDLSAYEAFELLRHWSRSTDRPLRDVALKVVHGTWVDEA